jgi:tetratricopeptide (TPR) repeat protein
MSHATHDAYGHPLTLADAASERAADDFTSGFVACEARVVNVLEVAAHDDSVYVQAAAAAVHLFAESRDAAANARPFVERALASRVPASGRERRFARIVAAWADGDVPVALALLEEQLALHPRDLVALKLAHYLLFNLGDSPAMLRLALGSQAAAGDVAHLHGMTAFAWEQCHRLREAEAAALRAIAMRRDEPWAHHALAHVMLTEGRIAEGRRFLEQMAAGWVGLNSFMQTHNWWHQALFLIEQDEGGAALDVYDRHVWGVCKDYTQDQIGAVSLLARLELAGTGVGERWHDVAAYLAARTRDQQQPFLDLHYAYGLARAGRPEAGELLANVEAHALQAPAPTRDAWQRVAVPACRGLLAHARGDWRTAVEALGAALPRLIEIGGSHAQRDLFEQIHVDALVRAGRLVAAQQVLEQRARSQPESRRLRRQLAPVYCGLGLPGLA